MLAGAPASLLLAKGGISGVVAMARRALSHRRWECQPGADLRRYPARCVAGIYVVVGLTTLLSSGAMRDIYLMPFLPAMALLALPLLPAQRRAARALDGVFLLLLLVIVVTALELIYTGSPRLLHGMWPGIDHHLPGRF